jgi:hypothetical protein
VNFFIINLLLDHLLVVSGFFGFEVFLDCILCFFEGLLLLLFFDFGFELRDFFFVENVFLIELVEFFIKFLLLFEMGHFFFVLLCPFVDFDGFFELLDFFIFLNELISELSEFVCIVQKVLSFFEDLNVFFELFVSLNFVIEVLFNSLELLGQGNGLF